MKFNRMKLLKVVFGAYFLTLVALFFYSFTQVDLSLTLTKTTLLQAILSKLQYFGFYQRPISAVVFITISLLLFVFYVYFLSIAKKITPNKLFILIGITFISLVFSYNAFSYDLFNYIFDAKILTFYHQNPYLFKPLDFASDPMLSFMRWTHRLYPYGPSWLLFTAPLSFIGSNVFLLTFFMFKILIGLAFLGSSLLIYKISEFIDSENKIFNTIFWSFNPLIIIEGLVSAHNDFALVFFSMLAFYLYLQKKKFFSFLALLFSIGVKYLSFILIPIFGYLIYLEKRGKKIQWDKIILASVVFSLISLAAVTYRTTFQPWYLIFPLSLAALIAKKYFIIIPAFVASLFMIFIYTFYVLLTDYSPNYPQVILNVETIGLFATIASPLIYLILNNPFSRFIE